MVCQTLIWFAVLYVCDDVEKGKKNLGHRHEKINESFRKISFAHSFVGRFDWQLELTLEKSTFENIFGYGKKLRMSTASDSDEIYKHFQGLWGKCLKSYENILQKECEINFSMKKFLLTNLFPVIIIKSF